MDLIQLVISIFIFTNIQLMPGSIMDKEYMDIVKKILAYTDNMFHVG